LSDFEAATQEDASRALDLPGLHDRELSPADFYEDKRVTVLGATGLIGSYMVKWMHHLGAKVTAIFNERRPNEFTKLADVLWNHNLLHIEEAEKAVRGAEIVMDLAGVTGGVGMAMTDPTSFVALNAVLGANILHACYLEHVGIVGFPSSTVVYQELNRPVREQDLSYAFDPYPLYYGIGWTKRYMEKLCKYYHDAVGMKIAVVRPSGAYGRYDNFVERTSHVLPGLIARAERGKDPLVVWGDGKDVRDLVHASDIARGLLLAVMLKNDADPINIASGRPVTTCELARMVLEAMGSRQGIEFDVSKPRALRYRAVDITKAREILGFEPEVSLEEGIGDTVAWYRGTRE